MTHLRKRLVALAALVVALLIAAPILAVAHNDPEPAEDGGQGNVTDSPGLLDPGVTDAPTGGVVPSLPVPSSPVPDELPGVPTSLDPESDSEVGADGEPVTVDVTGKGVQGTLTFTGRDVEGTASGLDPDRRYVSLLYGSMSTDRPGEALTCADIRTAADVESWSISGEWVVDPDGNGTLSGTASRDLADGVETVSIRQAGGASAVSDSVGPLTGFTPVTSPVAACGSVPGA